MYKKPINDIREIRLFIDGDIHKKIRVIALNEERTIPEIYAEAATEYIERRKGFKVEI